MTNVRSPERAPERPHLSWQPSLLDILADPPEFDPAFAGAQRFTLDHTSWVDHVPGWVRGADELFTLVLDHAPWTQHRVRMYERMVDEPRLSAWHGSRFSDPTIPAIVPEIAAALSGRYDRTFDNVGAALYRDGRDSVAWHGDRVDPTLVEPVVALISLGSRRMLRMRARFNHRDTRSFTLAPGDLLVMGGEAQHGWEHSIPKVARAGARLSLQFPAFAIAVRTRRPTERGVISRRFGASVLSKRLQIADAFAVALMGRRNWIRMQGRANAALLLLAREMNAEFVEPSDELHFARVRGRVRGCTFELRVAESSGGREPTLALTVRHFHTQNTGSLDGEGLHLPDLDPAVLQAAIEAACNRFATEH